MKKFELGLVGHVICKIKIGLVRFTCPNLATVLASIEQSALGRRNHLDMRTEYPYGIESPETIDLDFQKIEMKSHFLQLPIYTRPQYCPWTFQH
jgi:hypothetical protein